MMIRILDILISILGIILTSPIIILVSLFLLIYNRGKIFFFQDRVGLHGKCFKLVKFKTMIESETNKKQITIGNDSRITYAGRILRGSKIDELPQLLNVLKGEMSFVGPRPEVPEYVDLYTESQKIILSVKPGITDRASIEFSNESELLGYADDPEKCYINEILPKKIALSLPYAMNPRLNEYFKIILRTLIVIISHQ